MGAVVGSQLGQNALHMTFHCLFRNVHLARDALVRIAVSRMLQDFGFAAGQQAFRQTANRSGFHI